MSTPERTMATTGGVAGSGGLGGAAAGTPVAAMIAGGFAFIVGLICGMGAARSRVLEGIDAMTTTAAGTTDERAQGDRGAEREAATAATTGAAAAAVGGTAGVIVGAVLGGVMGFLVGSLLGMALGESRGFWRARAGR